MRGEDPQRRDVFRLPGYGSYWAAETVSEFGTYITTIALQVLLLKTLGGTAFDAGLLNASRWLPYLLLGLVVGALIDRRRRKPIMVGTDLGRVLLLAAIPLLFLVGWLTIPVLLVFVALFGVLSLVGDSASLSFLPRLVPPTYLVAGHARRDQSSAIAQTSGPAIAGALVTAVGAPIAVLVDAFTYLFSAVAVARIRVDEPKPDTGGQPLNLRREVADGLRWVYRHPMLRPHAISGHGWFLFNGMMITIFVPFVLLELSLSAFQLGLTLAAAGVAGLLGALLSTRVAHRWGVGRASIAAHALAPIGWAIIAVAPALTADRPEWMLVAVLAIGQAFFGFSTVLSNASEMGYRQAVTPDGLQGRMNTTIRSINRGMIVVGAPVGGFIAVAVGYDTAFAVGIAGFALVAVFLAASPFRLARHGDTYDQPLVDPTADSSSPPGS